MRLRIKHLILEMVARQVPDFHESSAKRAGYWFRREGRRPYYEMFVIQSSQKERVLGCDVAWSFFPIWDGAYGGHQMRASAGLPNLRLGSRAIAALDSYYEHNGTVEGIRRALDRIGSELVEHALPWLESQAQRADGDLLLQHGLDWTRAHRDRIPTTFKDDLLRAFDQAAHLDNSVRRLHVHAHMPLLEALKSELRAFAGKIDAPKWYRQETAILAEDLLIYASQSKRNKG